MNNTGYSIATYADGYGRWNARIRFTDGAGNTGEGERLIANAKAAARRAIHREIDARRGPRMFSAKPRMRFEIVSNSCLPSGALAHLTIREA